MNTDTTPAPSAATASSGLTSPDAYLSDPKFSKFRASVRRGKIRAGSKIVIDTSNEAAEEFPMEALPTIEVKMPEMRIYMPLAMPDRGWFFASEEERDRVLNALNADALRAPKGDDHVS